LATSLQATQVLVWFGLDDPRLSKAFREKLLDAGARFPVSSVAAFESRICGFAAAWVRSRASMCW